jgi:hypothetical protein
MDGRWPAAEPRRSEEESMHFVETLDGALFPLGKIDKLWANAGSVWIKAGDETHQIVGTLDEIRDALEPITPAAPGWAVITAEEDGEGRLVSILAEPIVAWRDCERGPTPITVMQSEKNILWAIKTPDGEAFDVATNRRFVSDEEWLASARLRWRELRFAK